MAEHLAEALRQVIDEELTRLLAIPDEDAGVPGRNGGWSQKEELGHLIDSAANNHQRFVRAALEAGYNGPGYQQDEWVKVHGYAEWHWTELTTFWQQYNALLAHVIDRIPEDRLKARCVVGTGEPVTLGFLIEDYVHHMQHHLDHILGREKLTTYGVSR